MFAIYSRMPEDDLRHAANLAIEQLENFFNNNPDREDCRVEFWYGKVKTIKRQAFAEQVNQFLEETIIEDKQAQGRTERNSKN